MFLNLGRKPQGGRPAAGAFQAGNRCSQPMSASDVSLGASSCGQWPASSMATSDASGYSARMRSARDIVIHCAGVGVEEGGKEGHALGGRLRNATRAQVAGAQRKPGARVEHWLRVGASGMCPALCAEWPLKALSPLRQPTGSRAPHSSSVGSERARSARMSALTDGAPSPERVVALMR